jgi:hypothetical protein
MKYSILINVNLANRKASIWVTIINSTLLPFIKEQPMSISNVTDKAFCHGVINSFISNECCWLIENPEIVIFSCDFDKKHFLKELQRVVYLLSL